MLNTPKEQLKATYKKYLAQVPEPLCSQFPERRSRDDAIKRHEERSQLNTQLYPTEQEQSNLQTQLEASSSTVNVRKTRTCKKCQQPMKGHPRGACPSTSN
ncbi:PREDICTED: uncharacterized protein LOC109471682 [Branchiostoma belcheri]|uniref:Uncharacterized protein LOC109471682 n=1 Tax=Branchiostoma belcheri TaxID=7741 RepID=A0A6P4YXY4_BRABE|nr:PREDICTED: uncharacterized protein LOC109471682 [Branchiostoma belcheri]